MADGNEMQQALQSALGDDKPVEVFLTEYEELQKQVQKIDMSNMTDKDRHVMLDYAEHKDFLDDVRNSLDFVKSGAMMFSGKDSMATLECRSLLFSLEDYASLSAGLTNNFDERFMAAVESTRTEKVNPESESMNKQEYLAGVQAPLRMAEISTAIRNQPQVETIGDIRQAVEKTSEQMKLNCIDRDNVIPQTVELLLAEDAANRTTVLAVEDSNVPETFKHRYEVYTVDDKGNEGDKLLLDDWNKVTMFAHLAMLETGLDVVIHDTEQDKTIKLDAQQYREHYDSFEHLEGAFPIRQDDIEDVDYLYNHKPPKPVEIVESSDGYVMASSEITAENEAEFAAKVNQAMGEVIHNEAPQETTIDPSRVGGKVKLEEAGALGSIELQQIESGGRDFEARETRYEDNPNYDETPSNLDAEAEAEEEQPQDFSGFDDIL